MQNDTPYKGLMPYSEEDADFFFGREKERKLITANLMASRLTLLYGSSGVGKSSVLRAGVISHLRKLEGQSRNRRSPSKFVVVIHNCWSDDPLHGLINSIESAVGRAFGQPQFKAANKSPRTLNESLRLLSSRIGDDFSTSFDLFVILDQFEEFFLYPQRTEQGAFVHEFPLAVNNQDLRVNFLLSLREDWLASLDRFKGSVPSLFDNALRIDRLDCEAARAAIVGPVKKYNQSQALKGGREVALLNEKGEPDEDAFVTEVLEELDKLADRVGLVETGVGVIPRQNGSSTTKKGIQTPYLQLVMTRLWNEAVSSDHALRKGVLTSIGAEPIVQQHLKRVMDNLTLNERDIAACVFHYLVTPSGTKIAQKVSDLSDYTSITSAQLNPVLETLSQKDNGILTQIAPSPEMPDVPRYEIFHDVLSGAILAWRKEWEEKKRHQEALEEAARQRKLEHARWFRWGFVALSILLFFMAALTYVAVKSSLIASRQENEAKKAGNEAKSRELATSAISQLQIDPELSLLLATRAVEASRTTEAIAALRKSLLESHSHTTFRGHTALITKAVFSPDGKLVATASEDKTARLWDVATGKMVATFHHGSGVHAIVFSPDGRLLATESGDGKGKVWDIESKQEVFELTELEGPVAALAFSPDSKRLVSETKSKSNGAKVWDVASHQELFQLRGNSVSSIAFSPDGKWIVTASVIADDATLQIHGDKTARVWDAATGRLVTQLQGSAAKSVKDVRFSADSKFILTYSNEDVAATIWEAVTWRKLSDLSHVKPVQSAAFSPNSLLVLTVSADNKATDSRAVSTAGGMAQVWSVGSSTLNQYPRRALSATLASFSPDSKFVVSSTGSSAQVWVATTGNVVAEMRGHTGAVYSAQFSSDQKWLLTASDDKTARIWDVSSLPQVLLHSYSITAAAFSPDSKLIATAHEGPYPYSDYYLESQRRWLQQDKTRIENQKPEQDRLLDGNTVQLWNVENGQLMRELRGHANWVYSIAYSSDGQRIVTGSADGTARVWESASGAMLANMQSGESGKKEAVVAARFSPDDKLIFTVRKSMPAKRDDPATWAFGIWNARNGHLVGESEQEPINSASFSPDAGLLVTTNGNLSGLLLNQEREGNETQKQESPEQTTPDNVAKIWSTAPLQSLIIIRGHKRALTDAEFSADGKLIVTTSLDKTAQVWRLNLDKKSAENIAVFEHPDSVYNASFSPDGSYVVTSSGDNVVRIWDVKTEQLVAELGAFGARVRNAVFSPTGNLIAASSQDKTAQIYTCEVCASVDTLLMLAHARATRELTAEEQKKYLHQQ